MAYKYKNVLNLQAPDKVIREILSSIQHTEHGLGSIDFNTITPMPPWVLAGSESAKESWCKENWGAPENASGLAQSVASYDGGDTIEFDTLGSDVRELMRKLSMMFPQAGLVVDYLWASEDVGADVGAVQFIDGEQVYEYIPEAGSSAAFEMAFDVFATNAKAHGLVFDDTLGTYRYEGSLLTQGEGRDGQEE